MFFDVSSGSVKGSFRIGANGEAAFCPAVDGGSAAAVQMAAKQPMADTRTRLMTPPGTDRFPVAACWERVKPRFFKKRDEGVLGNLHLTIDSSFMMADCGLLIVDD